MAVFNSVFNSVRNAVRNSTPPQFWLHGKTVGPYSAPTPPVASGDALLLQSGDFLLLQNGDKLLLQG